MEKLNPPVVPVKPTTSVLLGFAVSLVAPLVVVVLAKLNVGLMLIATLPMVPVKMAPRLAPVMVPVKLSVRLIEVAFPSVRRPGLIQMPVKMPWLLPLGFLRFVR